MPFLILDGLIKKAVASKCFFLIDAIILSPLVVNLISLPILICATFFDSVNKNISSFTLKSKELNFPIKTLTLFFSSFINEDE